ncbi:MAG: hypothetical protein H0U65_05465, partial [Rubrobacter sp.]|nr:hypothetical protein [Rubrobacter sp.]
MSRMNDGYEGIHDEPSRGVFSREEFLRLALGAGAGMALSGSLAALASDEARAGILGGGEFPIGIWWPPPPAETTAERYREIKDAGFNFVIGGNGVGGDATNSKALEAAAEGGIRFILTDYDLHRRIRGGSSAQTVRSAAEAGGAGSPMRALLAEDELRVMGDEGGVRVASSADVREGIRQRITALLDLHGGSSALEGMNLYDEPRADYFGNLSFAKSVLSASGGAGWPCRPSAASPRRGGPIAWSSSRSPRTTPTPRPSPATGSTFHGSTT